jgi:hypothetical protein
MMTVWVEEAKQAVREIPWAVAAFLCAIVYGLGGHASIFYQADGDNIRMVADRDSGERHAGHASRLLERVEAATMCEQKIPGFTVVVGLREYSFELSVPVEGMRSLLKDAQMRTADGLHPHMQRVA